MKLDPVEKVKPVEKTSGPEVKLHEQKALDKKKEGGGLEEGPPPVEQVSQDAVPVDSLGGLFDAAGQIITELMFPCVGAKVQATLGFKIPVPIGLPIETSVTPGLDVTIERTATGYKLTPALELKIGADLVPGDIADFGGELSMKLSPNAEAASLSACWAMVKAVTLMEAINAAKSVHRYFGDFVTLISGGEAHYLVSLANAMEHMQALPDFDEAKYDNDEAYKAEIDAERAKVAKLGMTIETAMKGMFKVKLGVFSFGIESSTTSKEETKYGLGDKGLEMVSDKVESEKSTETEVGPVTLGKKVEGEKTTWSGKVKVPAGSAGLTMAVDLVAEAIAKQQGQIGHAIKGFALPSVTTLVPNFDGTLTVEVELVVEEKSPMMKLSVKAQTGFEGKAMGMGKVELKRTIPVVHEAPVKKPVAPTEEELTSLEYDQPFTQEYYEKRAAQERKKMYPGIAGFGGFGR
jgi:hypothetical protein